MTTKYVIVCNTSPSTIVVDQASGKLVFPGEFMAVQRSQVQEQISNGEATVVDYATIGDEATIGAKNAKSEYDRLDAEWEAEKAAASTTKVDSKAVPADYDDSGSKSAGTSKSSASKSN